MFLISALGFLVYIFIRFFIPKKESGEIKQKLEVKENHKDFVRAIFNLLKTKKLFLTLLASVIDSLASSPVYIFLPFLLLAKGIHITQYGIATGIFFIGSLFGRTVLGRGVDKIGNLKVFIVSETFMAGMLVCLALSSNFLLILLFVFLLGMFTRGTTPVVQTMFSQASHKMHYDKIYAISELFIGLAAVVTIILMGIIADKIGVYFVFYTSALLALFAIVPTLFLSKVSSQID